RRARPHTIRLPGSIGIAAIDGRTPAALALDLLPVLGAVPLAFDLAAAAAVLFLVGASGAIIAAPAPVVVAALGAAAPATLAALVLPGISRSNSSPADQSDGKSGRHAYDLHDLPHWYLWQTPCRPCLLRLSTGNLNIRQRRKGRRETRRPWCVLA